MNVDHVERRIIVILFAALLAFSAWGMSVGWNNEFLPGNEYRQTHTAITTLFIQREHNFSLAYPTPLLGKPWSIPYEFPLYQWSVVRLSNATGLTLTQSARTVSAACFYLALPAVWLLLAQLGLRGPRRCVVLAMVLSCPLYIFYARAFLIEMMALMFSLWFLASYVRAVERRSVPWLLLANVAGLGAGLVKVTTFLLYLIPAALWSCAWLWRERPWQQSPDGSWRPLARRLGWIVAATAAPFAATLWWIRFADRLKGLNPSSRNLMSAAMNDYHFGTWKTRLDPKLWHTFEQTLTTNLAPLLTLGVFAVIAIWRGGRWRAWIAGCVLVFVAGPVIFPLLYSWHEYYFSANGVLLMAAIGLAWCGLLESTAPRWFASVVIFGVLAAQLWTYFHVLYPSQRFRSDGQTGLVRFVHDITGPDDVLLIAGADWAPMIPYYSQRRALMLRRNMDTDMGYVSKAFETLQGETVDVMLFKAESRDNASLHLLVRSVFGLEAAPVATWDDVAIYINPSIRSRVVRQFHSHVYSGVVLDPAVANEVDTLQFVETATASLTPAQRDMFRAFIPEPVRFSSRFALGIIDMNPHRILMVHPNSRLFFQPAAGRRKVTATFGILPSAYEHVPPPDSGTEGVVFSIIRQRKDLSTEVIFKRLLDPKRVAADRGLQALELSVPVEAGDELVFATQAGPTGIYNRTWSYWESAEIR